MKFFRFILPLLFLAVVAQDQNQEKDLAPQSKVELINKILSEPDQRDLPLYSPTDQYYQKHSDAFFGAPNNEKLVHLHNLIEIANDYSTLLSAHKDKQEPMTYYERVYNNQVLVANAFSEAGHHQQAQRILELLEIAYQGTWLQVLLQREWCNVVDSQNLPKKERFAGLNEYLTRAINHPEFMRSPDPGVRSINVNMLGNLAYIRSELNDSNYPASPIYLQYFETGLPEHLFTFGPLTTTWEEFVKVAKRESFRIPNKHALFSRIQKEESSFGRHQDEASLSDEKWYEATTRYHEEMVEIMLENIKKVVTDDKAVDGESGHLTFLIKMNSPKPQ